MLNHAASQNVFKAVIPPPTPTTKPTTKKPLLHTILQNESAYPFTKTAVTNTVTKYTVNYFNPETINAMAQTVAYPPVTTTTTMETPTVFMTNPEPTTTESPLMTIDPLFAHYKQVVQPIRGPPYLIIEGHSKVKKYGPNDNSSMSRAPIIVPVEATQDPVIRHVINSREDATKFTVKHLHTKPSTDRTVVEEKPDEQKSPMNSLLSFLDTSFGNFVLDDEKTETNRIDARAMKQPKTR